MLIKDTFIYYGHTLCSRVMSLGLILLHFVSVTFIVFRYVGMTKVTQTCKIHI